MMGRWFRSAWRKNTIVSGVLAIMIWGTICYMAIAQLTVPALLSVAGGAVITLFLRLKVENGN